ncbi:GRAM domain-containing protein 2B-like isoform X3 [Hermetia illucens]|uniref:GRAM domain-containing protein 2B-like isoform X3 n=1 Tax=Hermetia illucens TaxID=343691 RepID=UPI0018CC67DF|nr:GRAM domain-containing protein 2B-like isoform X3 [Hermetia illucens]
MGRINVGSASGEIMLCFVQGITGNRPVRCNSYEEPPTSAATTTKRKYVLLKSRSTNSVGFGIRSAPSSPMAPLQGQSEAHGQSVISLNAVPQSPSHQSAGSKLDSKSLKHLSAPVTASSNRSISPHPQKSSSSSSKNDPPPEKEKEKKRKELSSSRQKKFHRHFQQVSKDERVINYYSCALVSDILLQGHLYITENYFAFYSNVFGFVTKLLIPTASVVRISKEKTAKIIPNAVGVATADERHVFGSFMSREAAFRLMCSVCQPLEPVEIIPKVPDIEVSEECSVEDDSSCSISGNESPPQAVDSTSDASQSLRQRAITSNFPPTDSVDGEEKTDIPRDANSVTAAKPTPSTATSNIPTKISKSPPPRIIPSRTFKLKFPTDFHIVYIGVVLTLILTMFSAFLLYRILDFEAKNKNHSNLNFKWGSGNDVDEIYAEALRWQKEMQTRSTEEAQIILNSNLEQIARVRRNLESLSSLIHDRKLQPSQSYEDDGDGTFNTIKRGYNYNARSATPDLASREAVDSNSDYGASP